MKINSIYIFLRILNSEFDCYRLPNYYDLLANTAIKFFKLARQQIT